MGANSKPASPDGFERTASRWAKDQAEQQALEARALEDARADQAAVWALADLYCPSDIREFGERHKIPELSMHLWRSAFVAGWRSALRAIPQT